MKITKKIIAVILAICMMTCVLAVIAACKPKSDGDGYTYRYYTSSLGNNWNPHSWETNADDSILEQTTIGFVDIIYDGEGAYKWQYEMATAIEDITASASAADKTKWGIGADETGRMWKIGLNPNAKWENGEKITADDYVWSMQQQLSPELSNYRANSYYSNDTAIVGAKAYYNQGKTVWKDTEGDLFELEDLVPGADGSITFENKRLAVSLNASLAYLGGYSLNDYIEAYPAYFDADVIEELKALADRENYILLTKESLDLFVELITSEGWEDDESYAVAYIFIEDGTYAAAAWETVGLYKVDDYTIVYVTEEPVSRFDFLISCAGASWLVHKATYEASIVTASGIKTSKYGTSKDTYFSYGPYKLDSYEPDKQIVYTQNENWYGWEEKRGEHGELVSHITLSDGTTVRQFQTTKIIVDVMTPDAAKQAFLKGDLDDYGLTSDDMADYRTSDRLYQVDETYTMRFFFNTSKTEVLDQGNNNQNSVVLTNVNFRKAFSLAINRTEFCATATAGYKPAFALLNTLYYYNVENDPSSIYRTSEWGKKAVVDLYGIEYGAGKTYATLDAAYAAVTGYDLDQAKALMKTACDELVAAGKYTKGQPIKIQLAYSPANELTADGLKQQTLINQYLNAAVAGSGFGQVTIEYVCGLTNRYQEVINGNYAIGWGAWGGAAFYPFKMFECYLEPDAVAQSGGIHESGCFNPRSDTMTIEAFDWVDSNGQTQHFDTQTMTWEQWSLSNKTTGNGQYVKADINLKLAILSKIETAYLSNYYCVPVAGSAAVGLDGYKIKNITDVYNIMYGFGGLRFMSFNYSDKEWSEWVSSNSRNGVLPY